MKYTGFSAVVLTAALTLSPLAALAQAHPQGTAQGVEAPGGSGLAPMADEEPAAERSMAFSANAGQCRDTVPGGNLLAYAYATVIALLGFFVLRLQRKNASLEASLDALEKSLDARRPKEESA